MFALPQPGQDEYGFVQNKNVATTFQTRFYRTKSGLKYSKMLNSVHLKNKGVDPNEINFGVRV